MKKNLIEHNFNDTQRFSNVKQKEQYQYSAKKDNSIFTQNSFQTASIIDESSSIISNLNESSGASVQEIFETVSKFTMKKKPSTVK